MKVIKRLRDILVWLFLTVMILYPLYMKNGFVKLATAKKELYYIVSCICLVPGVFLSAILCLGKSYRLSDITKKITKADRFAVAYLFVLIISTLLTDFPDAALAGNSGWYTGLTTQLFFIFSFLLISHSVRFSVEWLFSLFFVSGIIYILCILARFHVNVFGLYNGRDEYFWNAFIPTIGQKNWYACFLVIVYPIELGYFLVRENRRDDAWLIPLIAVGAMAMVMQDSDSIYVGMLFVLLYLFEISCNNIYGLKRFFLELSVVFISLQLLALIQLLFSDRMVSLSSMVTNVTGNIFIRILGGVCLILYALLEHFSKNADKEVCEKVNRIIHISKRVILVAAAATILLLILLIVLVTNFPEELAFLGLSKSKYFVFNDNWGTYRGVNWKTAIECFLELNPLKKLFGIGPDCYYSYVSLYHPDFAAIWSGEISNAHNELLTALVNTGMLGAICYYGIFISLVYRTWRIRKSSPLALLLTAGIIGFMFNNIFSFMNIISTPLLFTIAASTNSVLKGYE